MKKQLLYGIALMLNLVIVSCGGGAGGGNTGTDNSSSGNSDIGVPDSIIGYRLVLEVEGSDGKPTTISAGQTITYTFVSPSVINGDGLVRLNTTSWSWSRSGNNGMAILNYVEGTERYTLSFSTETQGIFEGDAETINSTTGEFWGSFTIYDVLPPSINEIEYVENNSYTFNSSESGSIYFTNACVTQNGMPVIEGENTISLNIFEDGEYDNCTLRVRDNGGNYSTSILTIPNFVVDTVPPTVTVDSTPGSGFDFTTSEAGFLVFGGDCSSSFSTGIAAGPNTIDKRNFGNGDYIDCNFEVFDKYENSSGVYDLPAFSITWTETPLNDTGVTQGGNYPNENNDTCIGETISQQDCSNGRDVTHNDNGDGHAGFSFTKLDNNGNDLPITVSAPDFSCVRDNVTGLVWEVKTDDGGIHDRDNTYRWSNINPILDPQFIPTYTYTDWTSLVNGSNSESLCGFDDWRVPDISELESIVSYKHYTGVFSYGTHPTHVAVEFPYFPKTMQGDYWSSSPSPSTTGRQSFFLNFLVGNTSYAYNDQFKFVRLVRGVSNL